MKDTQTILLACDYARSVTGSVDNEGTHRVSYAPFGYRVRARRLSCLGFNGEKIDEASGHYLLGHGYRAFNPSLMRLHSPDSMSPFGAGGMNAYSYCKGDPINSHDPTGHAGGAIAKVVKRRTSLPLRDVLQLEYDASRQAIDVLIDSPELLRAWRHPPPTLKMLSAAAVDSRIVAARSNGIRTLPDIEAAPPPVKALIKGARQALVSFSGRVNEEAPLNFLIRAAGGKEPSALARANLANIAPDLVDLHESLREPLRTAAQASWAHSRRYQRGGGLPLRAYPLWTTWSVRG